MLGIKTLRAVRADPEHVHKKRNGIFAEFKNDLIACAGEFIGTVLFLLFALGAAQTVSQNVDPGEGGASSVTNPTADLTLRIISWFYISIAFGFSLFAFASIFYRFTGSIFNPSVGLALWLSGVIGIVRFVLTAFAQMLGGIVAAAILDALTPGYLGVNARLSEGTSRTRGLFIEMFGTAALTLSVLMLAAEKHNLTPMAPLGFGFMLFVVMLFAIGFTGGSINTARAFGPDVVSRSFPNYHWIYWLGPTLGALVSTGLYVSLKYIGYWRINPLQDSTDVKDSALNDLHIDDDGNLSRVSLATGASVGGGAVGGDGRLRNVLVIPTDAEHTRAAAAAAKGQGQVQGQDRRSEVTFAGSTGGEKERVMESDRSAV